MVLNALPNVKATNMLTLKPAKFVILPARAAMGQPSKHAKLAPMAICLLMVNAKQDASVENTYRTENALIAIQPAQPALMLINALAVPQENT